MIGRRIIKCSVRFHSASVKLTARTTFETDAIMRVLLGKRAAQIFVLAAEKFVYDSDFLAENAPVNAFFRRHSDFQSIFNNCVTHNFALVR